MIRKRPGFILLLIAVSSLIGILAAFQTLSEEWTVWLDEVGPIVTKRELSVFKSLQTEEDRKRFQRLVVEKDGLVIKFRNAPKDPLIAMAPDKFTLGYFNIEFVRKGKKVTGFELSVGRAGHIEFIRE